MPNVKNVTHSLLFEMLSTRNFCQIRIPRRLASGAVPLIVQVEKAYISSATRNSLALSPSAGISSVYAHMLMPHPRSQTRSGERERIGHDALCRMRLASCHIDTLFLWTSLTRRLSERERGKLKLWNVDSLGFVTSDLNSFLYLKTDEVIFTFTHVITFSDSRPIVVTSNCVTISSKKKNVTDE